MRVLAEMVIAGELLEEGVDLVFVGGVVVEE